MLTTTNCPTFDGDRDLGLAETENNQDQAVAAETAPSAGVVELPEMSSSGSVVPDHPLTPLSHVKVDVSIAGPHVERFDVTQRCKEPEQHVCDNARGAFLLQIRGFLLDDRIVAELTDQIAPVLTRARLLTTA
eukprot:5260642-Amphidinium_carterae.1